jgi:PAS domain S-box-containing protein
VTNHGSIDPQRAGARWRESEKLFQRAFQATPTPIVLTRLADGVIVSANEAFLKTSGYTEAEIVGQNVMSLNIYASPEQRDEYLGILRERGSVRDREQLLRTKSGAVRTILLSGEIIELDGQKWAMPSRGKRS